MIRVGFIGLGHNGIGHIEAHKRVGKSEVVALCDMNPERLKSASEKFDVEKTYNSADELCKQEDIDAVSINTGDQFHMEPFLSALENEKHIFVEKPLANAVDQVEMMVTYAHSASPDLKIAVGYILRFNPVFEAIYDICRSGEIGQIYYMEGDYIHNLLYQANQTDILTGINWYLEHEKPLVGGGSHPLDLLRWFSGAQVAEAMGYSNRIGFPEMREDDCQIALFKFDSGAIAKVTASYAPKMGMAPYYNLRIYGTMGTIERDQVAISSDENDIHPEFRTIEADRISGHPYDKEVEDWLDSINESRSPRCDLYDGASSTMATLVAAEAIKLGIPLPVSSY